MKEKILIVEDDNFKANDLKAKLDDRWKVVTVASVRDAVVKVMQDVYDVIILDMALPTFTADAVSFSGTAQPQGGVEVLRALKSKRASTPVIIVSQYPDLEVDGVFLSLEESPRMLSDRYGIQVVGAVVYDFQNENWVGDFRNLVNNSRGC